MKRMKNTYFVWNSWIFLCICLFVQTQVQQLGHQTHLCSQYMLNNIDCTFSNISVLLHSGHLRSFHVHFGFIITVDLQKNTNEYRWSAQQEKHWKQRNKLKKRKNQSAMMLDVRLLAHCPLQTKGKFYSDSTRFYIFLYFSA